MAKAWKVALASLLGGVGGGATGYADQSNKQKERALKELEIETSGVPSSIRELGYYEEMSPEKQADFKNLKAAGAGIVYGPGGKSRVLDDPSLGESNKAQSVKDLAAQMMKANPDMLIEEATRLARIKVYAK